jgi:cytochrome c oxidase cbb3-type subunit 3
MYRKALAVALIAAGMAAWAAKTFGQQDANPYGDAEHVQAGKKLYVSAGCIACHGGNARGAVGPDLTDQEWLRPFSIQMVHDTIANGRSGTLMSPFKGDLTDEQIWSLVSYILDEGRKRKEAAAGGAK